MAAVLGRRYVVSEGSVYMIVCAWERKTAIREMKEVRLTELLSACGIEDF